MPIKPISFQVHDVRLVKDFTIEYPNKGVVLFRGKNNIGKTTLLNCMRSQFSGDNTTALSEGNPNGWTEGQYLLPSGETVILRQDLSENKSGSRFVLVDQDGNVKKKVSDVKDLFGFNDLTIEDFIEKGNFAEGKRQQRNIFLDILPQGVKESFLKMEEKEAELYKMRTDANVTEMHLRNVVEKAKPSLTDNVKAQSLGRIEKEYLVAEKSHLDSFLALEWQQKALIPISEENGKLTSLNNDLTNKTNQYKSKEVFYNNEIAELERKLTEKKAEKEQELKLIKEEGLAIRKQRDEQQVKCSSLQSIDLTLLEKDESDKKAAMLKLKGDYEDANASQRVLTNYQAQVHGHKEALAEWTKLDDEIKQLRLDKENLIYSSDCPMKNVRLTPDGIEMNIDDKWLPFSQENISMSSLIIATAQIIVLANKNLKVVLVSRGESLCKDRIESLLSIADKEDALFLVERVDDNFSDIVCEIYEP